MANLKPIIKFNNGIPIAVCNRCFITICYITFVDDDYVVRETNYDLIGDACTSVKKGGEIPSYCEKCNKLLNYNLNE